MSLEAGRWCAVWGARAALIVGLAGLSGACDDRRIGPLCAEGAAFACTCGEGRQGSRICRSDRIGACECPDPIIIRPDIGDPDGGTERDFELIVEPERLDFGGLDPGQSRTETVAVTNIGPAPARINFSLEEDDEAREFSWGDARDHTGLVLGAGERVETTISYNPTDTVPDTGTLWISDHRGGVRGVVLEALASIPDIEGPLALDMGEVPTGSALRRSIFLRNGGGADLLIDDILIDDNRAFSLCLALPEDRDDFLCPPGDALPTPLVLAPGEVLQVHITYRPRRDGPDTGTLVVRSNDPDEARYEVALSAGGAAPCVEVDTDEIDFGEVPRGQSATRRVRVTNCSPLRPLTIGSLRATGDIAFSVVDLPLPLPGAALRLDPGQSATFSARYAPSNLAAHTGAAEVISNDPENSPLRIDLRGQGVPFDNCPLALGGARVVGQDGPFETQVGAEPLDTVVFDASRSFDPDDPDAGIAGVEWTLIERPEDSNGVLTPDGNDPTPSLFLDLAGRYVVELRVFDSGGTVSCEALRIVLLAVSPEDIHVQLVWDTPNDRDQTDTFGADMDLHFLHPNGEWGDGQWDCHWTNTNPDWATASRQDNPSLDIDDTNGSGPENINLDNPEPIDYKVGVHYYGDNSFGDSTATVRIFLGGVLVFEAQDEPLSNRQFWEVATVHWARVEITPIGIIHDEIPGGTP